MKRLARPSRHQLALILEPEPQHELPPDQRAALLIALADLLLQALGMSPPEEANTRGEADEP